MPTVLSQEDASATTRSIYSIDRPVVYIAEAARSQPRTSLTAHKVSGPTPERERCVGTVSLYRDPAGAGINTSTTSSRDIPTNQLANGPHVPPIVTVMGSGEPSMLRNAVLCSARGFVYREHRRQTSWRFRAGGLPRSDVLLIVHRGDSRRLGGDRYG